MLPERITAPHWWVITLHYSTIMRWWSTYIFALRLFSGRAFSVDPISGDQRCNGPAGVCRRCLTLKPRRLIHCRRMNDARHAYQLANVRRAQASGPLENELHGIPSHARSPIRHRRRRHLTTRFRHQPHVSVP